MATTKTFKLDAITRKRLIGRGINLECDAESCEDKELKEGQMIVSVTRIEKGNCKTLHYHDECREKQYIDL